MSEIDKAFSGLVVKLEAWLHQIILMLPNLLIALLVLVITLVVAKLLRRASENLLHRVSHSLALNNLIANVVYIGVVLIGIFFALGILKLDKTVTSLLAGVGIIGLALGFAFQDIAANFIAGVFIATRKPFNVGDVIKSNDYFGIIEKINMRTVDIRQVTGELVKVPNKMVFENPIINYNYFGIRRIDLPVGVSYGENLEKVKQVILDVMHGITGQVEKKDVEVMYTEFGDSSINLLVRFWIHYNRQTDYVQAKSEAIMKIKKAFDANYITIPFPIRTLDFGIKGGEKLTEHLQEWNRVQ